GAGRRRRRARRLRCRGGQARRAAEDVRAVRDRARGPPGDAAARVARRRPRPAQLACQRVAGRLMERRRLGRTDMEVTALGGDGAAARHAVESGRFDTLQISVSVADQEAIEAVLPAARQRQLGVIAKRPVANAVWASSRRPGSYHVDYWERLRALDYDFLGR